MNLQFLQSWRGALLIAAIVTLGMTAYKAVFGPDAPPVSSTKSMTGHLLGGAAALEAVVCVQAILTNTLPPTINYTTPDPACDLDYVPNVARGARVDAALSNSFGFGGHNASVIFSRFGG